MQFKDMKVYVQKVSASQQEVAVRAFLEGIEENGSAHSLVGALVSQGVPVGHISVAAADRLLQKLKKAEVIRFAGNWDWVKSSGYDDFMKRDRTPNEPDPSKLSITALMVWMSYFLSKKSSLSFGGEGAEYEPTPETRDALDELLSNGYIEPGDPKERGDFTPGRECFQSTGEDLRDEIKARMTAEGFTNPFDWLEKHNTKLFVKKASFDAGEENAPSSPAP